VIHQLKDRYTIQKLCFVLKCSRSGYYDWIALGKPAYKAFDESLNKLIVERYEADKRQGITRLKMNLKKIHGLILTKATVYRYMRLNGIQSIIRKKRHPWGTKPHHQIPNLLKRDFTTEKPNEKWSIDVSFLFTKEKILYLCAIKDLYDKSIISYKISRFNNNPLVFETFKAAMLSVPLVHRKNLILHSDQGVQFIAPMYARLLEEHQVRHSVSYRGSCVDNAPIESWFSALKTESIYLYNQLSEDEMIALVYQYVRYYNEERLQEKIKELAPIDYRKQALSTLF
jgi:putative transposase